MALEEVQDEVLRPLAMGETEDLDAAQMLLVDRC